MDLREAIGITERYLSGAQQRDVRANDSESRWGYAQQVVMGEAFGMVLTAARAHEIFTSGSRPDPEIIALLREFRVELDKIKEKSTDTPGTAEEMAALQQKHNGGIDRRQRFMDECRAVGPQTKPSQNVLDAGSAAE